MANDLTGDFDVVAEFAIPAANRVIAAMHRVERFLHTMSVRVDDSHQPGDLRVDPSIVASVDEFGDASVNHDRIPPRWTRPLYPTGGGSGTTAGGAAVLDQIVNTHIHDLDLEPLVPSRLKGRAQLQLSPPTISVPDSSGRNVTVTMDLRARYFPDPNTPPVAPFVRGKLAITAAVNQVASQNANVVEIDIKGHAVTTSFTRDWSSEPISAEDLAGINQLIKNSLRTSFLPSNTTLPSSIAHIQFKTMRGAQDALAVMLDMSGNAGNAAGQTNVFLGADDDFAFAAGADFIQSEFRPTLEKILSQHIPDVSFTINGLVHTWHITYDFKLNSVTLELKNGSMVLVIKGHAHTDSWPPNFDFTVKQEMTLAVSGSTAELVMGNLSIDTNSWVIDRFKGTFTDRIRGIRDHALSQTNAQAMVRKALDADAKLGALLDSLLKPQKPAPGAQPKAYTLAYTSAEIRTSGIVLHGTLSVSGWPEAHVEFEEIPTVPGSHHGHTDIFARGPSYSGLKSWIPGGKIDRFEWKKFGQTQPLNVDENTFVYTELGLPDFEVEAISSSLSPTPVSDGNATTAHFPGFLPLCLVIRGSRLSASGPAAAQSVVASVCGFNSFPIISAETEGTMAMIALTQPGPDGMVEVTGHAAAPAAEGRRAAPNLIVHFPAGASSSLDDLSRALADSKRSDATTAIIAVVERDQLQKTRYTPGVVYAEDDGEWEKVFGARISERPATLVLGPNRNVLWRKEGTVDARELTEVLRKSLVRTGKVKTKLLRSAARIGQAPPNFLFEYAPGRDLTLRKLVGRRVVLVFWKGTSAPSLDAIASLGSTSSSSESPIIIAIGDGETSARPVDAAVERPGSVITLTDPDRSISKAYGINVWPTIITIDSNGLITGIRYGSVSEEMSVPSTVQQSKGHRS